MSRTRRSSLRAGLVAMLGMAVLLPSLAWAEPVHAEEPSPDPSSSPSVEPEPPASVALLPDMRLYKMYGLTIRRTSSGRKRLRFGTRAFNIGAGALEVRGRARSAGTMTELYQYVYDDQGGGSEVAKPAGRMFWAGDGHAHWHIDQFINVELYRVGALKDSSRRIRKIGFCLIDLVRSSKPPPNTPPKRVYGYQSCGSSKATASITMGISVGYADDYQPLIAHQWIDITSLPKGVYRLCAKVNPLGQWQESEMANNFFWYDLWINARRSRFEIRASGRSACGSYAKG